jgi:hypothetical protein
VNDYLQRLTRPMPVPRPRALTGLQALAVEMNPQRRNELLDTFQGAPYRADMAQFQFDQARQGQAAGLAEKMETTQEAERYRRTVQENTAAYRQRQLEFSGRRTATAERRTDIYAGRAQKGAGPKDWASELGRLDKEIDASARGISRPVPLGALTPQADLEQKKDLLDAAKKSKARGAVGGWFSSGPDPQADEKIKQAEAAYAQAQVVAGAQAGVQQRYQALLNLRQRLQKYTSNPEFQKLPRQFQNGVIERLMTTSGFPPERQEQPAGYPPADLGDEDLADAD